MATSASGMSTSVATAAVSTAFASLSASGEIVAGVILVGRSGSLGEEAFVSEWVCTLGKTGAGGLGRSARVVGGEVVVCCLLEGTRRVSSKLTQMISRGR